MSKQPNFFAKKIKPLLYISLTAICLSGNLAVAESGYPVAGLNPDQRPQNAPSLKQPLKDKGWYQQALKGVDKPYPPSMSFLEFQGGWYTPFNHSGMTKPYDIRGWHQ